MEALGVLTWPNDPTLVEITSVDDSTIKLLFEKIFNWAASLTGIYQVFKLFVVQSFSLRKLGMSLGKSIYQPVMVL